MESVPTSSTAVNIEQIESFLESVYSKALDVLEANIRRMAHSSVPSIMLAYNQSANLFLKEVTSRAVCVFSYKLSRLVSSVHFQFGLFKDVDVKHTPPMVHLNMHDGNGGSLPEQKPPIDNEIQRDIQSGWSLTSNDNSFYNCEVSKTQQMLQDIPDAACLKVEAVQSFGNSIKSPPDPETNRQSGKDTEPIMSASHPNNVDIKEPGMLDLKEPNSQEAKITDIGEFTSFHPARDLLQSVVYEKQTDPYVMKQCDSQRDGCAFKAPVNVSSEASLQSTHCSQRSNDEHDIVAEYPSGKFSQHGLIFDGPVGEDGEGLDIEAEIHEGCSSVTGQMKVNKDQEVPDSHQQEIPMEKEESSLYYTLDETKDGGEVSLDPEQISSSAAALGCHWFTSSTEETTDMSSSRRTSQKLPSIPVCNRRRRVGLSRKQKVPALHTKRLKLSEQ